MMKKIRPTNISLIYGSFVMLLLSIGCAKDNNQTLDVELRASLSIIAQEQGGLDESYFIIPDSDDYSKIPQDPKNPISNDKARLGQLLYHESALGINPMDIKGLQKYSCASCHFAKAGFQAGTTQGIGEGGIGFGFGGEGRIVSSQYDLLDIDVQPIRTPTTLNSAYQTNMLWNGMFGATGVNTGTEAQWTADTPKAVNHLGYEGIESQAIAGAGVHRLDCNMQMATALGYSALFDRAFPDISVPERYDLEHAGLAIAAYERTLLANYAPFQKWLKGNTTAMSDSEKKGAILFFGEAQCSSCHNNPALSSMEFYALGMNDLQDSGNDVFNVMSNDPIHLGRGGFTNIMEDNYKFKTPQLYNLSDSPFYGHGSSFNSIEEVIRYKNKGIPQNQNVAQEFISDRFHPLHLTEEEIMDLTQFIETALYDPILSRYEPQEVLSGSCIPNNDILSRVQLGCE